MVSVIQPPFSICSSKSSLVSRIPSHRICNSLPSLPLPLSLSLSIRGRDFAASQNDTFSSTSAFLSGTFNRMKSMAKRQGGHWCWFMAFLGLVFWIFVILWVIRR